MTLKMLDPRNVFNISMDFGVYESGKIMFQKQCRLNFNELILKNDTVNFCIVVALKNIIF